MYHRGYGVYHTPLEKQPPVTNFCLQIVVTGECYTCKLRHHRGYHPACILDDDSKLLYDGTGQPVLSNRLFGKKKPLVTACWTTGPPAVYSWCLCTVLSSTDSTAQYRQQTVGYCSRVYRKFYHRNQPSRAVLKTDKL